MGLGERTLSQSAACPAGGFSYKLEITPYANLLPTPPQAPFIGPAAPGLPGTVSVPLPCGCLVGRAAGTARARHPNPGALCDGLGPGGMRLLGRLLGVLSCLGAALEGSPALRWHSTSCHLARSVPGSPSGSLSFLGRDAQGLAVFHAHWDGHGRLQACSRQEEPELTAAFSALCEISRDSFVHSPGPELRRALAALRSQWGVCPPPAGRPAGAREKRAAGQRGAPGVEHPREKRGWTMPGTLWCGFGDSARNSTELGEPRGCGLGGWGGGSSGFHPGLTLPGCVSLRE